MKRNRFLTRTIFFIITLFLITFGTNYTFGVNIITGSNAQNVIHPRKVYVIWYYAANEDKRGDADQSLGIHWRTPGKTDYITPSTVRAHLQHVVEYFDREVDKTFEFYKSGNEIHVEDIQSNLFYVNSGDTSNAPNDHFLDTDHNFWSKAWQDIEGYINTQSTLQPFNDLQNIYLVLVQSNYGYLHDGDPNGFLGGAITNGGKAMVALGAFETYQDKNWTAWSDEEVKSVIAHELGHIFGLQHDFNTNGIMSYDFEERGGLFGGRFSGVPLLGGTHLSKRSKNWLSVHPDFSGNPPAILPADNPLETKVSGQPITQNNSGLPPGNDIMLTTNASTGTPQYKIFVQMDDIDGFHQVELRLPLLSTAPHSGSAVYDPTGQQKHYSLGTYLTPQGGGGPFPGGWPVVTNMTEEIDITQWVEESMDRGEDSFDLIFIAIDKQGNISYADIDKHGDLVYTHSYTVFHLPEPVLEVTHPKESVWVTETSLAGATVLLELKPTGAAYVTDISTIRDAVEVDGIEGVTIDTDKDVERISDNEIKVTLDFDHSDFDTNANLTFSVAADAITRYIGGELTAELYVLAHEEELHASTQLSTKTLTEETLDKSEVLLQLNDAVTYEEDLITIQNAVNISGIAGVSVKKIERTLGSSRSITVVLDFDGTELHTNKVLTFSVDAAAIKNYKGDPLTVDVPVTARIEGRLLKMYWTSVGGMKIQRANLDGTNIEDIVNGRNMVPWVTPLSIALDADGGKMYWTNVSNPRKQKIRRANLDGSNIEDLVTGLTSVSDIALDVEGGKIYWANGYIWRANLDGTNIELIIEEWGRARYFALDVEGGKIYWTTQGSFRERIWRANLDGSDRESFTPHSERWHALGIALDVKGGKMYWTDGYNLKILRANLDGSNREDLVTGLYRPVKIVLDVERGKMYWTDHAANKIRRANLDGSNVEDLVRTRSPYGIAIAILPPVNLAKKTNSANADVNGDGIVNIQDLVAVAAALGKPGENNADVNGDGEVNIQDLVAVAAALGIVPAAPSIIRDQAAGQLTSADVQHWLTQAQQANLTDAVSLRGIRFLEQLLATLTPKKTALLPNYPNPFNPETWIPYQLAKAADVTLTIYDTQGRVVRALDLGHQHVGMYQTRNRAAHWDGRNDIGESVASGVYFYTLKAGDFSATRKMLILK